MREYREQKEVIKVVSKVICNCCGKEITKEADGVEHMHFEKLWGYYSNKDGRMDELDICESCYDKWVQTFVIPPTN